MFQNVGGKIKIFAIIFCIIGILFSVVAGIKYMVNGSFIIELSSAMNGYATQPSSNGAKFFVGLFIMVFGFLSSWFSNLVLYGIGELIENSQEIAYNTKKGERPLDAPKLNKIGPQDGSVTTTDNFHLIYSSSRSAYVVQSVDSGAKNVIIPAFYNDIPVREIGANAFSNDPELEFIRIPKTITRIQANAFQGCSSLKRITYLGSEADWNFIVIDHQNDELKHVFVAYDE